MLKPPPSDGEVYWWESLCLLLLYVLYVVFMRYNERILTGMCHRPEIDDVEESDEELGAEDRWVGEWGSGRQPFLDSENAMQSVDGIKTVFLVVTLISFQLPFCRNPSTGPLPLFSPLAAATSSWR